MKYKNIYILLFAFAFGLEFNCSPVFGQDISYVNRTFEQLTAPGFYGRGYVNHGERKAARYIASQFSDLGLEKFSAGYVQRFKYPVNTFPSRVSMIAGGKELKAGRDFLVTANSRGIEGTFGLVWMVDTALRVKTLQKRIDAMDLRDKFIVIAKMDELVKNTDLENVRGVIMLNEKGLVWSVSNSFRTRKFTVIEVIRDSFPEYCSSVTLNIDNDFRRKYPMHNLIAYVKGSEHPDSFIVFTAHYDHLGMLGPAFFPGANDNASGTSMLLDLARHYSRPGNQPACSIAFMAFTAEELGLLGSKYYTENPLFPLSQIRFLINLDMVGTGSKGIRVVNGTMFEKEYSSLEQINKEKSYLVEVGKRGESAHSDHHPFYLKSVPAVFIYTMGDEHTAYHSINDIPDTVPFTEYEDLFRLITDFVKTF